MVWFAAIGGAAVVFVVVLGLARAFSDGQRLKRAAWLRWPLVAGLLAGALVMVLGGTLPEGPDLERCTENLNPGLEAEPGFEPATVTTCNPYGASDGPVLILLVIAGVLIAVDFSEFSLAGFVSLKREVERQERKLDALTEQLKLRKTKLRVLSWPIEEDRIREIQTKIDDFQIRASAQLTGQSETVEVRKSIFFLDPSTSQPGHTAVLRVPPGLKNVSGRTAWFIPGQGATGFVFDENRSNIAWVSAYEQKVKSDPDGQSETVYLWDQPYRMDRRLSDDHHSRRLHWIVSAPVRVSDAAEPGGSLVACVFNIDCIKKLDGVDKPEDLLPLLSLVERFADEELAPLLLGAPQTTVYVGTEPVTVEA
jgi:hypothetical protein